MRPDRRSRRDDPPAPRPDSGSSQRIAAGSSQRIAAGSSQRIAAGSSQRIAAGSDHPLDRDDNAVASLGTSRPKRRRKRGTAMTIGSLLIFALVTSIVAAGFGYVFRSGDTNRTLLLVGLSVIVVAPGILLVILKLGDLLMRR